MIDGYIDLLISTGLLGLVCWVWFVGSGLLGLA